MPGLDGLRAVAVIAVILFHADLSWSKGGYLGVDLFFVISGFLITGLLVREVERTGKLDLIQFYLRRARRLLPASWLMTVAVILLAAAVATDALHRLRYDALASLFYVTNWELIFAGKSYFETMGRQPLLLHLWSLAIEEQFYIVWAPVIFFVVPRWKSRALGAIAAAAMVLSIGWMAVLAWNLPASGDPTRLYFGTDTHGFALLAGALLAVFWRCERMKPVGPGPGSEGNFLLGLIALGAMALMFARMSEDARWLYPWGFLLSALASAGLIAAATYPGSYFGKWLDLQPMRWIGERSYGIYLWHWPVFMLTRPGLDIPWTDQSTLVIRIGLTVAIAALSYRFVETPIRQGSIDRLVARLRLPRAERMKQSFHLPAAATLAAVAGVTCAIAILVSAPSVATPPRDVARAIEAVRSPLAGTTPVKPDAPAADTADAESIYDGADLTVVGDSVVLGSSPTFSMLLPGAKMFGAVGWQAQDILNQIRRLHDAQSLTPVVLIHLGTNGYVSETQLREMLSLLADRKLVLVVNTRVPRRWMEPNNALIDDVLPDYPNATLVDWKSLSQDQKSYFVSDGVHLTLPGQRVFVSEIARVGRLAVARVPDSNIVVTAATDPATISLESPEDRSDTLVRYERPAAPDSFWHAVARCESRTNWQKKGRFSGGLGIYVGSWKDWGGLEFAPTPGEATSEQQIVVANRISTQGWTRPSGSVQKPVGFAGWGCVKVVGQPELLLFTPQSILLQQYAWLERALVVRELQMVVGLPRDGVYGRRTRAAHLAALNRMGLSMNLASAHENQR